jgi:hypothetical protein
MDPILPLFLSRKPHPLNFTAAASPNNREPVESNDTRRGLPHPKSLAVAVRIDKITHKIRFLNSLLVERRKRERAYVPRFTGRV